MTCERCDRIARTLTSSAVIGEVADSDAARHELVPGYVADLCGPCARAWGWHYLTLPASARQSLEAWEDTRELTVRRFPEHAELAAAQALAVHREKRDHLLSELYQLAERWLSGEPPA